MNADDLVLVALANDPRDIEIAECYHWYRIPARHAPKYFTGAQYLAFYFGRAFGERKWTIREYAPVRGHELVRRRDLLPEEPEHSRADELYYKLQLGDFLRREPPITSKRGRRILFIWTSYQRFMAATEINDLFRRGPLRDKLFDSLRTENLDVECEMIVKEGRSRYRVDFMIYCPRGRVAVLIDGAIPSHLASNRFRVVSLPESALDDQFGLVLERIRTEARDLSENYSTQGA